MLKEDPKKIARRRINIFLSIIAALIFSALLSAPFRGDYEAQNDTDTSSSKTVSQREQLLEKLERTDSDKERERLNILIDIAKTKNSTSSDSERVLSEAQTYIKNQKWPDLDEKLEVLKRVASVDTSEWLTDEISEVEFFLRAESDCQSAVRNDILNAIQNPSTYEYNYSQRYWVDDVFVIRTEFSAKNALTQKFEFVSLHHCKPNPETERYSVETIGFDQRPHTF